MLFQIAYSIEKQEYYISTNRNIHVAYLTVFLSSVVPALV